MRTSLIVFAIAAIVPPCVGAQPVTAKDIADHLKSGDTVYVLDDASREITGVFGKVSGSALTLMVNGELRDIPFSEVRRITRRGGDPIWNGMLIGAGVGAVGGSPAGGAVAAAGAVIYGAIGAILDWAIPGRVVVYRAAAGQSVMVAPFLGDGRRGVRVSIGF